MHELRSASATPSSGAFTRLAISSGLRVQSLSMEGAPPLAAGPLQEAREPDWPRRGFKQLAGEQTTHFRSEMRAAKGLQLKGS